MRERLLEAATELFTRRGYAATSVRAIVEAAGVTKPSLYYHFKSKEGIYLALLEQAMAEFLALVDELRSATGSPWERVRTLCLEVHGLSERRLPIVRLVYAIFYGPPQGAPSFDFDLLHTTLEQALSELLDEAVETGEIEPGATEDMALAVMGVMDVAREMTLIHPERALGREGLARLLDLLFKGLGRNKTRGTA